MWSPSPSGDGEDRNRLSRVPPEPVTATLPQLTAFGLLAGMMLLFVSGRIRYDLVAILALLAALLLGLVKPEDAFAGFADDIVVIVASALVISAAVERS